MCNPNPRHRPIIGVSAFALLPIDGVVIKRGAGQATETGDGDSVHFLLNTVVKRADAHIAFGGARLIFPMGMMMWNVQSAKATTQRRLL